MTAVHTLDSSRRLPLVILLPLALLVAFTASADPLADLASFSTFKDVNLEKLGAGSVQMARGPAMNFPRGLSVESVYVVRKPLQKTAELHRQWNPGKHSELKIYLHSDLPAHPALADFQRLDSLPSNSAVKSFVAATQKLGSGSAELQLSNAEVKAFASQAASGDAHAGAVPPKVTAFWKNVLQQRAQAFLSGGTRRLPPYESGKESIRPADEIARLLEESGKIRGRFAGLLAANPLTGGGGSMSPSPDWEVVSVEGQAAVSLGASYYKGGADNGQAIDGTYYSSAGYYVLITLYEFWPVKVGGQDATLVWRGDLISAASLATLHGIERMGSSSAMMRETKKSIEAFLKDAGGSR